MDKITASAETLVKQASMTSNEYFRQAIKDIDNTLGDGFAKDNPHLIGYYMQTSSYDYMTSSIVSILQEISESIENIKNI